MYLPSPGLAVVLVHKVHSLGHSQCCKLIKRSWCLFLDATCDIHVVMDNKRLQRLMCAITVDTHKFVVYQFMKEACSAKFYCKWIGAKLTDIRPKFLEKVCQDQTVHFPGFAPLDNRFFFLVFTSPPVTTSSPLLLPLLLLFAQNVKTGCVGCRC